MGNLTETVLSLKENILPGIVVIVLVIFCVSLSFLLLRHREIILIVCKTFSRDVIAAYRFMKTIRALKKQEKAGSSVGDVFDNIVAANSSKICFQFEDEEWTFQEVADWSNRIANYFHMLGYKKGNVVSLFMENRPEFVCVWMGLSKIGVVTSLINSNLRLQPLKHSLKVANSKAIIYGTELSSAIMEVIDEHLTPEGMLLPLFSMGQIKSGIDGKLISPESPSIKFCPITLELEIVSSSTENAICSDKPTFHDNLFYIFTSGTTGLPKAAIIKHARFLMGSISFHYMNNNSLQEVVYTCLPLYHTAGGLCGVGQAIIFGNTVVLRRKFSASRFWKDCVTHKVTLAQYIGEICRYLLSQPPSPEEKQHTLTSMVGNGLRLEIWKDFVDRFNIPRISEIYGSTDGNCNMVNFDGRVGAVGFVPILLYKYHPMGIIKVDEISGEPFRDPQTGLVVRCRPNEPGEFVGKIIANHPIREFQGYAGSDGKYSEKKYLRDVFTQGDVVFRTGDYLVMDKLGYFYFKDRLGDTFRWKGENVSTTEVESVISNVCDLKDCVVFGVTVPGTDGRACMAVLADPENSLDLNALADGIYKNLPFYARPLFLRVTMQLEITGTHKMKKTDLQHEGYNINKVSDPLYFYTNGKFVTLDEDIFQKIIRCKIRV